MQNLSLTFQVSLRQEVSSGYTVRLWFSFVLLEDDGCWIFEVPHWSTYEFEDITIDDDMEDEALKVAAPPRPPMDKGKEVPDGKVVVMEEEMGSEVEEDSVTLVETKRSRARGADRDFDDEEVPALGLADDMSLEEPLRVKEDGDAALEEQEEQHEGWTRSYDTTRMMIKKSSLFYDEYEHERESPALSAMPQGPRATLVEQRMTPFSSLNEGIHFKAQGERAAAEGVWKEKEEDSCDEKGTNMEAEYHGRIGAKRWKGQGVEEQDTGGGFAMDAAALDAPASRSAGVLGERTARHSLPTDVAEVASDASLLTDHGLLFGRSFRVGWAPDGTLIHAGMPCLSRPKKQAQRLAQKEEDRPAGHLTVESLGNLCAVDLCSPQGNKKTNSTSSASLHGSSIFSSEAIDDHTQRDLVIQSMQHHLSPLLLKHLEAASLGSGGGGGGSSSTRDPLDVDRMEEEDGEEQEEMESEGSITLQCKKLSRTSFDALIYSFVEEMDRQIAAHEEASQGAGNEQTGQRYLLHVREVWRLLFAMYGEGSMEEKEGLALEMGESKRYNVRVERRRRISRWLEGEVYSDVHKEAVGMAENDSSLTSSARSGGYSALPRVWALLSGGCIDEACEVAMEAGLLHLATLLATSRSDSVRRDMKKQLESWSEERAQGLLRGEGEEKGGGIVSIDDLFSLMAGEVGAPLFWRRHHQRFAFLQSVGKSLFCISVSTLFLSFFLFSTLPLSPFVARFPLLILLCRLAAVAGHAPVVWY